MSRVICTHQHGLPAQLDPMVEYFTMYESSGRPEVHTAGTGILRDVAALKIRPTVRAWDFTTFALAVSAADTALERGGSADGWTRTIDLSIALADPQPFSDCARQLETMLRFLTGDFWTLTFEPDGIPPPQLRRGHLERRWDADCVSLLSGGIDSLVGAVDLTANGRHPVFVSQIAKGDTDTQVLYAMRMEGSNRHLQLNHNIRFDGSSERSTRGRSIVFFAFAALAASTIDYGGELEVFVPENGFISLNVALNPGRLGSLSTKTTHPVFLDRLQAAWTTLGLVGRLVRPYAFKTKGELLAECADQVLVRSLVGESTSCGRFLKYGYRHCGRCVPCQVRRASFLRAGQNDPTPTYVYNDLALAGVSDDANDIGAVAAALLRVGKRSLSGVLPPGHGCPNNADISIGWRRTWKVRSPGRHDGA